MRRKLLLIPLACLMLAFFANHAAHSFAASSFNEDESEAGTFADTAAGSQAPNRTRQLPAALEGGANGGGGHSMIEVWLSFGVLVFGTVIMLAEIAVMLKTGNYWDPWSFKVLGLTFVLVSGLFLIVAGYSQDQTAPMMGLLGTVAGYLLGKEGPQAESPMVSFDDEAE